MINAHEAKRISKSISSASDMEALAHVEQAIKMAAENGKSECYIYRPLSAQVKARIALLGYAVGDCSSQREGDCFRISWED